MRKKTEITKEDFDGLLGRLAADTEEAGKKYEEIRQGLVNYFHYRGCLDAEGLADETINRVAAKLSGARFDTNFKLTNYFYSFASKIYLEDYKKRKRFVSEYTEPVLYPSDEKSSPGVVCLESCLKKQPESERTLLIKYYGFEKNGRVEQRRVLADEYQISMLFLHTKISRLKKVLRECLKKCLDEQKT